jgi:hypothetical protein
MFAILIMTFGFITPKTIHYLSLILSVPDEGYSKNALGAVNLTSTFVTVTHHSKVCVVILLM